MILPIQEIFSHLMDVCIFIKPAIKRLWKVKFLSIQCQINWKYTTLFTFLWNSETWKSVVCKKAFIQKDYYHATWANGTNF